MNTPETINIEKYAKALNNLIGQDHTYYIGDKNVDAIVEVIVAAKKLENRVKELSDANDRLYKDNIRLREIITEGVKLAKEELVEEVKTDTVRKMQERLNEKIDTTINVFDFQISECNAVRQVLRGVKNDINQITKEVLEENKSYYWVITENGCVITCPNCGERLELCYPDGTEVRYLPHCPWCGKKLEGNK